MRLLAIVFWRAFLIVMLTAINVTQIGGGHYERAFFSGGALSWVWWHNTRVAALTPESGGQLAYALGAAVGTVVGMFIGRAIR